MRRAIRALALVVLVGGVFWTGRVSTHGISAFFEHAWCPVPLAMILVGVATYALARRATASG
jgi:hypothetical protein